MTTGSTRSSRSIESDEWQKTMAPNGLMPFGLDGDELKDFVAKQIADIETLSREIGIIN